MSKKDKNKENSFDELAEFEIVDLIVNLISIEALTEKRDIQIEHLICYCIDNEMDDLILQATRKMPSQFAAEKLKNLVSVQSEFGKVKTGPHQGQAVLFAIPIVFMVEPNLELPKKLSNIDHLVSLFKKKGFVEDNAEIFLRDELLTVDDVDLLPSDRYKLLAECISTFCLNKSIFHFFDEPVIEVNDNLHKHRYELRFLICLAIYNGAPYPLLPGSEDYLASIQEWQVNMMTEISKQTHVNVMTIFDPQPLSKAIRSGARALNNCNLNMASAYAVQLTAKKQSHCHAMVSMHSDNDEYDAELRVSFFDDQPKLIGRYIIKLVEKEPDANYYTDTIGKILRNNGVDSLESLKKVLPIDVDVEYKSVTKTYMTGDHILH